MDEMAIKQQIHWTGTGNVGYIDFGTGIKGNDSLPVAKNVLVFMLVGVNVHWKIPIAYFLIDSVIAEDKANLVKGCLLQLESSGVLIKALTFDGCAANLAMCNVLGCNLSWPNIRPHFENLFNKQNVHIILDCKFL